MNFSSRISLCTLAAFLFCATSTPLCARSWIGDLMGRRTVWSWWAIKHTANFLVQRALTHYNINDQFIGSAANQLIGSFINPTYDTNIVSPSTGLERFTQAEQDFRKSHSLPWYLEWPINTVVDSYIQHNFTKPATDWICRKLDIDQQSWKGAAVDYGMSILSSKVVSVSMRAITGFIWPRSGQDEWTIAKNVACAHCLREVAAIVPHKNAAWKAKHLSPRQLRDLADQTDSVCQQHQIA